MRFRLEFSSSRPEDYPLLKDILEFAEKKIKKSDDDG